jgi:hypothetical protein
MESRANFSTTQLIRRMRVAAFATAFAVIVGVLAFSMGRSEAAGEGNRGQLVAYVWAENAKAASYSPSEGYRFVASKGAVTITRASAGVYTVKIGNSGVSGGHAQVTAYGQGAEHCKVLRWGMSGKDQDVHVSCFAANGTAADTQFALAFFN